MALQREWERESMCRWVPPANFDGYRLVRPLGAGGMGFVYLGHDLLLDRPVAIKFIAGPEPDKRRRERFLFEGRALARLIHPNVVLTFRVGDVEGRPFIVSEYVSGLSLDQHEGIMPWRRVLDIGIGLARGLAAAHRAGILHRDVKPANVVLTLEGTVKLIDFGLAKFVGGDDHSLASGDVEHSAPGLSTTAATESDGDRQVVELAPEVAMVRERSPGAELSRPGAVLGTRRYMAPERLAGQPASRRSDIFSLGCVLHELCRGRLPGDRSESPDTPVVPEFQAILDRSLARDPAERFSSADAVLEALESLADDTFASGDIPPGRTLVPHGGSHGIRKRGQQGLRFRSAELVRFLEAAYRLETDEQTWLGEVMEASRLVCGRGGWIHGAIYDASNVAEFRVQNMQVIDGSDEGIALLARGLQLFSPSFVTRTFRIGLASLSRKLAEPELAEMYSGMESLGYPDGLAINGLDPSGLGVFLGLWIPDLNTLSVAEMSVYRRMAHHLGVAYRCRRRIREAHAAESSFDLTHDAEAVLDAGGRVLHATGPAKEKRSQADLIETSQARDLARTAHADNCEGLRRWRPLTSARWTLIDSFERSGRRYVVARENQTCVSGLSALSERERQVVAYLAIGQSTKETAYALGISDTTVRGLLARAAAKLGVRTRRGVLDHPEVRPLVPHRV